MSCNTYALDIMNVNYSNYIDMEIVSKHTYDDSDMTVPLRHIKGLLYEVGGN